MYESTRNVNTPENTKSMLHIVISLRPFLRDGILAKAYPAAKKALPIIGTASVSAAFFQCREEALTYPVH